jgi:hypothetical protein
VADPKLALFCTNQGAGKELVGLSSLAALFGQAGKPGL